MLPQRVVSAQKRICCACQGVCVVRKAHPTGRSALRRAKEELGDSSGFCRVFCSGKSANGELLRSVLYSPLCAGQSPISKRARCHRGVQKHFHCCPRGFSPPALCRGLDWPQLLSLRCWVVVVFLESNGKSQSSEITVIPRGIEV